MWLERDAQGARPNEKGAGAGGARSPQTTVTSEGGYSQLRLPPLSRSSRLPL
jgi:hypothetical protein